MRPRAASSHFDDVLMDYISLKCKERLTKKDFDDATMETLRSLPLFQAIQVVHRFNDSVGPRVVNRSAFLVSIIRSTSRWWSAINHKSKEIPLSETGPNTHVIVQLCTNGVLNPDVFTPSVCHALQLLTPEQVVSVSQSFGSSAIALHVADDSYYAKQQLFLSMAHAALMQFPSTSFNAATAAQGSAQNQDGIVPPEATATEAAEMGRRRQEQAAAAQLPGILTEYIARTCASSNFKIRESDLDPAARDALKRVAFLQAMQAMQHFSVSIESDQVQNKSAYLMGIVRGQEQHWERSRASKSCVRGAKDLLSLHPRLLLKMAHLCLDGNLLPSDFSPEVCFELKDMDCDSAIRCVMAFNANKRICAGEAGGVKNRVGFFLGLLRNSKLEVSPGTDLPVGAFASSSSAFVALGAAKSFKAEHGLSASSELSATAKPFTPSATTLLDLAAKPFAIAPSSVSNTGSDKPENVPLGAQPSSATVIPPVVVQNGTMDHQRSSPSLQNPMGTASERAYSPSLMPSGMNNSSTTTYVQHDSPRLFPSASTSLIHSVSGSASVNLMGESPKQTYGLKGSASSLAGTSPTLGIAMSPQILPQTASPSLLPSLGSTADAEKRIKDMSRLLDSSRDAIGFLTSALARSRTSELRLRRELQETTAQLQAVLQTLRREREQLGMMVETARAHTQLAVTRQFDSIVQQLAASELLQQPQSHQGMGMQDDNTGGAVKGDGSANLQVSGSEN